MSSARDRFREREKREAEINKSPAVYIGSRKLEGAQADAYKKARSSGVAHTQALREAESRSSSPTSGTNVLQRTIQAHETGRQKSSEPQVVYQGQVMAERLAKALQQEESKKREEQIRRAVRAGQTIQTRQDDKETQKIVKDEQSKRIKESIATSRYKTPQKDDKPEGRPVLWKSPDPVTRVLTPTIAYETQSEAPKTKEKEPSQVSYIEQKPMPKRNVIEAKRKVPIKDRVIGKAVKIFTPYTTTEEFKQSVKPQVEMLKRPIKSTDQTLSNIIPKYDNVKKYDIITPGMRMVAESNPFGGKRVGRFIEEASEGVYDYVQQKPATLAASYAGYKVVGTAATAVLGTGQVLAGTAAQTISKVSPTAGTAVKTIIPGVSKGLLATYAGGKGYEIVAADSDKKRGELIAKTGVEFAGFASGARAGQKYVLNEKQLSIMGKVIITSPVTLATGVVGGRPAKVRSGKITKAEMSKRSRQQSYDRHNKFNPQKNEITFVERSPRLKEIYKYQIKPKEVVEISTKTIQQRKKTKFQILKDTKIHYDINLKEFKRVAPRGSPIRSITYSSQQLTGAKGPRQSKLYPKGWGSQSLSGRPVPTSSGDQYLIMKHSAKNIKDLYSPKRQPMPPKAEQVTSYRATQPKTIPSGARTSNQQTILDTPKQTNMPVYMKGFRPGIAKRMEAGQAISQIYGRQRNVPVKEMYVLPPEMQPRVIKKVSDLSPVKLSDRTTGSMIERTQNIFRASMIPLVSAGTIMRTESQLDSDSTIILSSDTKTSDDTTLKTDTTLFDATKSDTDTYQIQSITPALDTDTKTTTTSTTTTTNDSTFDIAPTTSTTTTTKKPSKQIKMPPKRTIRSSSFIIGSFKPTKPPKKTEPPFKPGLFNLPDKEESTSGAKVEGYNVVMKEEGRKVKANLKPLPKQEAHKLGRDIADNSLSASYKLTKAKVKVPAAKRSPLATGGNVPKSKFYKSKSGFYVEKNKYRLDTPGEKTGITASRLIAKRKKAVKGMFSQPSNPKKSSSIFTPSKNKKKTKKNIWRL